MMGWQFGMDGTEEQHVFVITIFIKIHKRGYSFQQMQGLAGNSKPIYEVCDSKSEKSVPMYCLEGTPLRYCVFAWIVGLTNLAQ